MRQPQRGQPDDVDGDSEGQRRPHMRGAWQRHWRLIGGGGGYVRGQVEHGVHRFRQLAQSCGHGGCCHHQQRWWRWHDRHVAAASGCGERWWGTGTGGDDIARRLAHTHASAAMDLADDGAAPLPPGAPLAAHYAHAHGGGGVRGHNGAGGGEAAAWSDDAAHAAAPAPDSMAKLASTVGYDTPAGRMLAALYGKPAYGGGE